MRKGMMTLAGGALLLSSMAGAGARAATPSAPMPQLRADQQDFFGLYKELIETNTAVSNGSCTEAAGKMAARLKAAGFKDDQLTAFFTSDHSRDGGLVAVYPGTDKRVKPMRVLAHSGGGGRGGEEGG